jgi:hypothetical protein
MPSYYHYLLLAAVLLAVSAMVDGVTVGADLFPPEIMPRNQWNAKAPDRTLMRKQTPAGIIVHHTSSLQRSSLPIEKKMQNLQSFSQAPGTVAGRRKPRWGDVPYHFYIDLNGRIAEGRDVFFVGDTNTAYDPQNLIQIVLEGDFEKEKPTHKQIAALISLMSWVSAKFKIEADRVRGHGDVAATDCPGRHLKARWNEIMSGLKARP